jgi:hypothetical protein
MIAGACASPPFQSRERDQVRRRAILKFSMAQPAANNPLRSF